MTDIDAKTPRDPWDASPQLWPTYHRTSVFGPLQLLQMAVILAGHRGKLAELPQASLLGSRGEGKKGVGKGVGET